MNKIQFKIGIFLFYNILVVGICSMLGFLVKNDSIWLATSVIAFLTLLVIYRFWLSPVYKEAKKKHNEADKDIVKFFETQRRKEEKDKISLIDFIEKCHLSYYIEEELKK